VRISWDPDFGEGDEFGAGAGGFVDEGYGLPDAAFEVEPRGLGSDLCMFSEGMPMRYRWRDRTAAALYLVRTMLVAGGVEEDTMLGTLKGRGRGLR
jgi:hypothetical protein